MPLSGSVLPSAEDQDHFRTRFRTNPFISFVNFFFIDAKIKLKDTLSQKVMALGRMDAPTTHKMAAPLQLHLALLLATAVGLVQPAQPAQLAQPRAPQRRHRRVNVVIRPDSQGARRLDPRQGALRARRAALLQEQQQQQQQRQEPCPAVVWSGGFTARPFFSVLASAEQHVDVAAELAGGTTRRPLGVYLDYRSAPNRGGGVQLRGFAGRWQSETSSLASRIRLAADAEDARRYTGTWDVPHGLPDGEYEIRVRSCHTAWRPSPRPHPRAHMLTVPGLRSAVPPGSLVSRVACSASPDLRNVPPRRQRRSWPSAQKNSRATH